MKNAKGWKEPSFANVMRATATAFATRMRASSAASGPTVSAAPADDARHATSIAARASRRHVAAAVGPALRAARSPKGLLSVAHVGATFAVAAIGREGRRYPIIRLSANGRKL
jgi:hypothetical protein